MRKTSHIKLFSVMGMAALFVGCAEMPSAKWEQSTPLCVALGALAGGAVSQTANGEGAAGVLVGAGVAYLICDKEPVCERGEIKTGKGCELDQDADGVVDRIDQCPKTPKRSQVDSVGCQLDDDADGVFNKDDLCPATEVGAIVDKTGCPLKREISLDGVNFEYKSSTLTDQARSILDQVVVELNKNDAFYIVEGHTDSVASATYNMTLSQSRADAVVEYLSSKGIETERIKAKGFGESQPVASNDSEEGRAKNRRVLLVPVE